jgi:orotidine-5'-phosphate decarboxylase
VPAHASTAHTEPYPREAALTPPFADRLAASVEERRSQICLGLDPDPAPAAAVGRRCRRLIDEAGEFCVAVKPQLACFERLGPGGWTALAETVAAARAAGLLIIADAKRGDVPHIASVQAETLVGAGPSGPTWALGADAVTINPLMGGDVIDAFLEVAAPAGAGLFVLVRTSNPGAADLLDRDLGGRPLFEQIAGLVAARGDRLAGESGLSGLGAVVGATEPRHLARIRELLPASIFLVPGVGAQGGRPAELGAAFGRHPASVVVNASRSIAGAPDPGRAAADLRDELWQVSGA